MLYRDEYTSRVATKNEGENIEQICVSLDKVVLEQLKITSEAMQIPLSATARLAILRGLNRIDDEKVI